MGGKGFKTERNRVPYYYKAGVKSACTSDVYSRQFSDTIETRAAPVKPTLPILDFILQRSAGSCCLPASVFVRNDDAPSQDLKLHLVIRT